MTQDDTGIDPRGPRFGQTLTGTLALAAFVVGEPWVIVGLAAVLGAGSVLGKRFNLWAQLYKHVLRRLLDPPTELEHPAPPRFAMTLGFGFLASAGILLIPLAGYVPTWIGWSLVLAVSGLALLAAITGICVGCRLFVLIQRIRGVRPAEVRA